MPTNRYHVWMPSLGPSEDLLARVMAGRVTWPAFLRAYRRELFTTGAVDARNHSIKNHGQKFTLRLIKHLAASGTVTLLCHCAEDERHCHRHELRKLLESRRV